MSSLKPVSQVSSAPYQPMSCNQHIKVAVRPAAPVLSPLPVMEKQIAAELASACAYYRSHSLFGHPVLFTGAVTRDKMTAVVRQLLKAPTTWNLPAMLQPLNMSMVESANSVRALLQDVFDNNVSSARNRGRALADARLVLLWGRVVYDASRKAPANPARNSLCLATLPYLRQLCSPPNSPVTSGDSLRRSRAETLVSRLEKTLGSKKTFWEKWLGR